MASAMLERLPSYFDQFNDGCLLLFSDAEDYRLLAVTDDFAVSKHSGEFCRFQNCKLHILIYKSNHEDASEFILNSLSHLTFTYYNVDALYGMYKYFISSESFITSQGELMDNLRNAVRYNRCHPHMEIRPSVLKKRLSRKKRKLHRREVRNKSIGTQTMEKSLYTRIDSILQSRASHDFMRMVDCMLDEHGFVESNFISFHCKSITSSFN